MDAQMTLVLLAVLLAAPCLVQLVLWTAYAAVRAAETLIELRCPGEPGRQVTRSGRSA